MNIINNNFNKGVSDPLAGYTIGSTLPTPDKITISKEVQSTIDELNNRSSNSGNADWNKVQDAAVSAGFDILGNLAYNTSGRRATKTGQTLHSLSSIANNIPVVGPGIGALMNIVGGAVNSNWGSYVNDAAVDAMKTRIHNYAADYSSPSSNEQLLQDFTTTGGMNFITNKDIDSEGRKATKITNELNDQIDQANRGRVSHMFAAANALDSDYDRSMKANFSAFGGPITGATDYANMMDYTTLKRKQIDNGLQYAEGGGIYIKPSKRGTFTAAATKRGLGVQEFASRVLANKEDYSPAMVKKANFARNSRNWNAFGGDLMTNGATWDNGFTYIGNGGSHEANPNEGVQVGVDPQGVPNLVEEGEVIWNDYVFSKRLKVPKSFKDKYKFKNNEPLSFADAAKKFAEENKERPNDPISKRGRDALLTALMDQQEDVRMKKQQREARAQFNSLTPDEQLGIMQMAQQYAANASPEEYGMMNTYPNQGVSPESQYAEGGELGNLFKGTGPKSNRMTRRYDLNWFRNRAKALGFDLGNFEFNPTDYDLNLENFNELYKQYQRQRAYETYLKGQRSSWENKEIESKRYKRGDDGKSIYKAKFYGDNDLKKDYIDIDGNRITSEAYNEALKNYNNLKKKKKQTNDDKKAIQDFEKKQYKKSPVVKGQFAKDYEGNIIYDYDNDVSSSWIPSDEELGKDFKFDDSEALRISYDPETKRSLQSTFRYVPAISAGLGTFTDALGLTNTPDYSSAKAIEKASERVGTPSLVRAPLINSRLTYDPFNINYYANRIIPQTRAAADSIMESAAGNSAQAMAGLLTLDRNSANQMGDLFMKGKEFDLERKAKVADYSRATDMFNAQQALTADRTNQAERRQAAAAYAAGISQAEALKQSANQYSNAARSTNLTNFVNSLGQIGEEAYDQDRIDTLIERGVLEDLYGITKRQRTNRETNTGANGGMLTKKKKRR